VKASKDRMALESQRFLEKGEDAHTLPATQPEKKEELSRVGAAPLPLFTELPTRVLPGN